MSISRLGCVYLNVVNLDASIHFYEGLLQERIEKRYEDRWAQFKIAEEFRLGLLNPAYDRQVIEAGVDLEKHYDATFIQYHQDQVVMGNSVVLNLHADDLVAEYERVKQLDPRHQSPLMYVSYMFPHRF